MSKTTFAQLPGLQKAAKILELQEQINTHHKYATWLLQVFNDLQEQHVEHADRMASMWPDGVKPKTSYYTGSAERMQIVCEWHGTQAMYLQCQLDELTGKR